MNTALPPPPRAVNAYLAKVQSGLVTKNILPPHISAFFERHAAVQEFQENGHTLDPDYTATLKVAQSQVENDMEAFAERRRSEHLLACRMETWAVHYPELLDPCYKLHQCRTSGTVGTRDDGTTVVVWDDKCNLSKLCPDESRQEQKRVSERYMPHLHAWVTENLFRQLFYGVFTIPNVPAGMLDLVQREIFDMFNQRIMKAREIIPENEREGRKKFRPMFPMIKGAFATCEAPLAASGNWNVHLNVILQNDGYLDYAKLRAAWGHHLYIQQLDRDPVKLAGALREVLKYSVQIVPTKSAAKRARHETDAPAMIEWTADQFVEWWRAQAGYRRTRTYGDLYKVEKEEAPTLDTAAIKWLGSVLFSLDGSYSVSLIPADKFSVSNSFTPDNYREYVPPDHYYPPP